MTAENGYGPHSLFAEYVRAGWSVVAIAAGTKGPRTVGWNRREAAITDPAEAGWLVGAGLLHAYSGTCALDIDAYADSKQWLRARGIDLDALLTADEAVQIRSGREDHAKLLYTLPEPLPSIAIKAANGSVLLELRCASAEGLSVQDVLPPTAYPGGGAYAWAGAGHWSELPPLPQALLTLWREELARRRAGATVTAPLAAVETLKKSELAALREALFFLNADAYEIWVSVGMALHGLGDQGRALWLAWSATSEKFDSAVAAKKWLSFQGTRSHWRGVLARAAEAGWVNAGVGARVRPEPVLEEDRAIAGAGDEVLPEMLIPAALAVSAMPAKLLPGWVGAMAAAVASATQTPEEASVLAALAMLATACHRRWEVEIRNGYVETLSLWTMTVLPSGSRKSAVLDEFKAPLTLWERQERDRLRSQQARVQAEIAVSEKRLETLKKRAAKANDESARQAVAEEIEAELRRMPEPLVLKRLYTGDITHEKCQQLLVEQDERIAIITDEGGVFATLAGAYSGGHASIDAFLQGFSGTAIRVDRGGRMAHMDRPAVSFGVSLQPGILAEVGKNKKFRDSGLLARFLFAVPRSNVGTRNVRAHDPIPKETARVYQERLLALLDQRTRVTRPELLTLSPAALAVWLDFAESIEKRMGGGAELEHLAEWLAKLPGMAARVAGLLHLALEVEAHPGGEGFCAAVGEEVMRLAVLLAESAISHANAAFALMGVAPAEEDAVALAKWLKAHRREAFLLRDVQRALRGRFPRKESVERAIDVLMEWNVVVRKISQSPGRQGGRPTTAYVVNPRLLQ